MKPEDIKLPGRYLVDEEQSVRHYMSTGGHRICRILQHFFPDPETHPKYGFSSMLLVKRFSFDSPWFLSTSPEEEVWIRSTWILGPAEEAKTTTDEPSSIYCPCPSPVLVRAFAGIAAAGESYDFCRLCGKERK